LLKKLLELGVLLQGLLLPYLPFLQMAYLPFHPFRPYHRSLQLRPFLQALTFPCLEPFTLLIPYLPLTLSYLKVGSCLAFLLLLPFRAFRPYLPFHQSQAFHPFLPYLRIQVILLLGEELMLKLQYLSLLALALHLKLKKPLLEQA
jgi:hypothetical protein